MEMSKNKAQRTKKTWTPSKRPCFFKFTTVFKTIFIYRSLLQALSTYHRSQRLCLCSPMNEVP